MCPNCGSCSYQSALVDEAPYRMAARGAGALRWFGDTQAAADVLARLAIVKIQNFLSLRWTCSECGASFDDLV